MAGTDKSRAVEDAGGSGAVSDDGGAPAIVLIGSQLGENIGTAARAMLNCGLTELRLVAPRDGWPNEKAVAAASGADMVLDGARLFDTAADAVADLNIVYATTARRRDMLKTVLTPRRAAAEMRSAAGQGVRAGVLFGPERKGLHNDDVTLADKIIEVPLNPAFSSLNLAQAVLIVAYEWRMAGDATPAASLPHGHTQPASKQDLLHLFEHLERELDEVGFLHPPEKRPSMVRNLRNIFQRADLREQEVRTLRGVIADLSNKRRGR